MLKNLIRHVETETGLSQAKARAALGILLNAADRQGAPLAQELFATLPGARPLAAKVGTEIGAATGEIARLIETTPGGRRYVTTQMIRSLHNIGLGHDAIGQILPALSSYMQKTYDMSDFATLGDLFGSSSAGANSSKESIAA
jgi:hypothetical protein